MREQGGEEYFQVLFHRLEERHEYHIENYGSDNNLRLTGKHETQNIDTFSWGVSDRGASIRVPIATYQNWQGYVEDRRPASNGDPYKIVRVISEALDFTTDLNEMIDSMFSEHTNKNESVKIDTEKAKQALSYLGGHDYSAEERTIDSIGNE